MSDFRQAAIDAILEDLDFDNVKELRAYVAKNKQDDYFYGGILHAINAVQDLSSAQPVARDTNVLSNDTIGRQAANSKESSLTQKALDTISKQAAINE